MAEKTAKEGISLEDLLSHKDPKKAIADISFEAGMRLLEQLVTKVESGELSLESSISSYERGMMILDYLRELLAGAEQKLKLVGQKAGA